MLILPNRTTQDVLESSPEFDGHGVVQDGIDGAVNVYHDATEQEKPGIAVFSGCEGVVDNHDPVWHPENGEHSKNNYKHSDHLFSGVGGGRFDSAFIFRAVLFFGLGSGHCIDKQNSSNQCIQDPGHQ